MTKFKTKTVYCLGNETDHKDCAALRLIPLLSTEFPKVDFILFDPTEEMPFHNISPLFIDTVIGINKAEIFSDMKSFEKSPSFSVHDYDLFLHLSLMKKLGKIKGFTIIGIPAGKPVAHTVLQVTKLLRTILP